MKTITAETKAWITHADDPTFSKNEVTAYSYWNNDMSSCGWVFAGTAEITLHLEDDQKIMENIISSLKQEQKKIQATAQMEVTRIEEKIQSLLCIECKE